MPEQNLISGEEVAKHNTASDCWIVVHGEVLDVTSFLAEHPGGKKVIFHHAGTDATDAFEEEAHSKDWIYSKLDHDKAFRGLLDPNSAIKKVPSLLSSSAPARPTGQLPSLSAMLNVWDFKGVAKAKMKPRHWAYYESAGDDEITLRENTMAFNRIYMIPRILRDVSKVDTRSKILGCSTAFPLYISATALGKYAHPDGEVALVRAARSRDLIYMMPTLGSCGLDEMMDAATPEQILFSQLYINQDRENTANYIRRAEERGCKALFLTVDAPELGRRERDMRFKYSDTVGEYSGQEEKKDSGTAEAITKFIDPSVNWNDIAWLKSLTTMPICLKGVQCGQDAILAVQHGIAGIVLSNHGGRQIDTSRAAIDVLVEVMSALKSIGAEKKMEVYVDGGIRRGRDIFKALALGATAIGIGRPTLWSLAAYGQQGVEKMTDLFKEEFIKVMRNMGARHMGEIVPEMCTHRSVSVFPRENLSDALYEPLEPAYVPRGKL